MNDLFLKTKNFIYLVQEFFLSASVLWYQFYFNVNYTKLCIIQTADGLFVLCENVSIICENIYELETGHCITQICH